MKKFNVGSKVVIKNDSRYHCQQKYNDGKKIPGLIYEIHNSRILPFYVKWEEDSYTNQYGEEDLELVYPDCETYEIY